MLQLRCQGKDGCETPATWRAGTWQFCEEHYKETEIVPPEDNDNYGLGLSMYGSSRPMTPPTQEALVTWREVRPWDVMEIPEAAAKRTDGAGARGAEARDAG